MNLIFKVFNLCKLYKNRFQKCQISQGGPLHPPDDQSGGWEAQGGPLHPPDFDRGLAPPLWTPLETASGELKGGFKAIEMILQRAKKRLTNFLVLQLCRFLIF